jgi:hypothetical protein
MAEKGRDSRKLFLACLAIALLVLPTAAEENENNKRCKREIVESYNLNGYLSQRPMNMYICPAIKMSCCSIYDQFMMFSTWKDKIKPKLVTYYDNIFTKYKTLKDMLTEINKIDIKKLSDELHISEKAKEKLITKLTMVNSQNSDTLLDSIMLMHHPNSNFMLKVRATFFCTICDHDSHPLIDIPRKIINISESTCMELATNTIEYSFFLNVKLAQYLQDYSQVLSAFALSDADKPIKLKNYQKIKRVVRACARAVEKGKDFKHCNKYCGHFKFNANSPVIEGYQIFFNEILNAMSKFLKLYGKEQPGRVLEAKKSMDDGAIVVKTVASSAGRGLQEEQFENFELKDLKGHKDIYDQDQVDPNFDEFVLNEMFNFQEDYEADRQEGYVNFIKNKLNYFDTEYDFENGDDSDIFKTNSSVIVDLENYHSKIMSPGISIDKHLHTCNIDNSMRDLIAHLKNKSKYKILYEKLDPALLEQINEIENDDVRDFHRDNFLFFKNLNLSLQKEQIVGKLRHERS